MERQGYDISNYSNFSVTELNIMDKDQQLDMLLEKKEEDEVTHRKQKTYIRYYINASMQVNNISEMVDDLFNVEEILSAGDTLFIIIQKNKITGSHMVELNHMWERYRQFVIIQGIKGLQFNILEHSTVPPHRILTDKKERDAVIARYNITDLEKFPEISRYDPVAQAIGMRPGDICEIIRSSKASIHSLYYRVCTNTAN